MKTDWNQLAWSFVVVAMIGALAVGTTRCHQLTEETKRKCLERHQPLECEKAVHL